MTRLNNRLRWDLLNFLTDVSPPWLLGNGVTAGHPAHQGVAPDEADHRLPAQSGQKDLSAPTARTLKTRLHAPPTKTRRVPATKSPQRGTAVCPLL